MKLVAYCHYMFLAFILPFKRCTFLIGVIAVFTCRAQIGLLARDSEKNSVVFYQASHSSLVFFY